MKKFSSPNHHDYESYWSQLTSFINDNTNLSLEELWYNLNYWDLSPSPERFYSYEEAQNLFLSVIKNGIETGLSLYKATNEKKNIITDIIESQINPSTDVIIEIGGGWGRNIFALYMNQKYPHVDFIVGEVSTSGQEVCSLISKNYNTPIISTYFNYYDWENLINLIKVKNYKNICIFSNHSIEQIPYLEEKMFDDFLNLNVESLKFTHIEPVGFQLEGGNSTYTGNSMYNQNLFPILLKLKNTNKITITKILPDYFSIGGWMNCGSLIQWEKIN
tara:strand:- start:4896 stop:5720 length:825 start_codon:yes stop_codon:yes gene_type:complete